MIYFIQAAGYIKIGYSATEGGVRNRFEQLRTLTPTNVELLGAVAGSQAEERMLHKRFRTHRGNGEWFEPTPELLAIVRQAQPVGEARLRSITLRIEDDLRAAIDEARGDKPREAWIRNVIRKELHIEQLE